MDSLSQLAIAFLQFNKTIRRGIGRLPLESVKTASMGRIRVTFRELTFRRGALVSARFAPDPRPAQRTWTEQRVECDFRACL